MTKQGFFSPNLGCHCFPHKWIKFRNSAFISCIMFIFRGFLWLPICFFADFSMFFSKILFFLRHGLLLINGYFAEIVSFGSFCNHSWGRSVNQSLVYVYILDLKHVYIFILRIFKIVKLHTLFVIISQQVGGPIEKVPMYIYY